MEKNRLYIALGVLAALVLATYLAYRKPATEESARIADPWRRIERAQITKLVIRRPGNEPAIDLEKRDNKWFMNQPGQGPADEIAVNDALEALSEMHVASVAAREPSSHAELEVDDAHALHVTLFRGGSPALDVFVGKNLDGGTAVRVPGNPTVYRVDRSIRYSLSKEPREWRDRAITHLERDHVRSVEWVNSRGTFRFDRNGDTWTPAPGNPPVERLDTARVNQTVVNLLDLRAMDFAAPGASTGITPASPRVTINVDNGSPVTLRLGGTASEGEVYVQREGSDIVYTVGHSHAAEIDLAPATIQAPAPSDGGTGDASAAADTGAAPAPAAGGATGGGSIPAEVMEQIRRQLQQRGINPGGH
jgi:hypothetical protein